MVQTIRPIIIRTFLSHINASSFQSMIKLRRQIQKQSLIPQEFWNAFSKKEYPKKVSSIAPYYLEKFVPLLEGNAYIYTLDVHNYIINFIGIEKVFYISIHARQDRPHILGCIDYNSFRYSSRKRMIFIKKRMDNHPVALILLHKIRREIIQCGLEIDIEMRTNLSSSLPFLGSLNRIGVSTLWHDKIKNFLSSKTLGIDRISQFLMFS